MSSTDLPLTEKGERQARAAKTYFRDILKVDAFQNIFSSPLIRARQTAEIIAGGKADIRDSDELQEMNLGKLEGLTWAERTALYPEIDIDSSLSTADFPGGETFIDIQSRCNSFLSNLARVDGDNILVVTHGITIRVLINCIFNKADHCVDYINWSDNTAISEILWLPINNVKELKRLNDRQHLAALGLETSNYEEWGLFSDIDYCAV